MAKNSDGESFPATISHPTAGRSSLEPSRIAIRWTSSGTDEEREALLRDARLTPADADTERPAIAVNRTLPDTPTVVTPGKR